MIKKNFILLVAIICLAITGCGNSAKESAEKVTELINKQEWNNLWNMVSEESKSKTEKQLKTVKSSSMSHRILKEVFNIEESEIETLTPQGYFVAIMQQGASLDPSKTKLINVETNGNKATIITSKGGVKTESEMIKEGSDWKIILKFQE